VRRVLLALLVVLLATSTVLWTGGRPSPRDQPVTTTTRPGGRGPVNLDPARFSARIDHPYWPMTPGSRWVYRETDSQGGTQHVQVTVLNTTKLILGIRARVVHDVVTEGGQVQEESYDWYAQDAHGNLWHLGEAAWEYGNGKKTSTKGSWQAGVDGAQPGILLPAHPRPGMASWHEDETVLLSLEQKTRVPAGRFDRVLVITESTPPKLEHKFYAAAVGPVLAIMVSGGRGREELISFTPGPAPGDRGAAEQAKAAARTAVPGATVREVERDREGTAGSTYEVELILPDGSTVEVLLDAGFEVLATDRDDRRNDGGNDD
jgi:hypothetical protein